MSICSKQLLCGFVYFFFLFFSQIYLTQFVLPSPFSFLHTTFPLPQIYFSPISLQKKSSPMPSPSPGILSEHNIRNYNIGTNPRIKTGQGHLVG